MTLRNRFRATFTRSPILIVPTAGAVTALLGLACLQGGCGSPDGAPSESKTSTPSGATATASLHEDDAISTADYVAVPGARIHPSCVHEVPAGAVVDEHDDVRLNGKLIAHYGQCAHAAVRTRHSPTRDAGEASPAVGPIAPQGTLERSDESPTLLNPRTGAGAGELPTISGWVDDSSQWSPAGVSEWTMVEANMVVPPLPASQAGQLLYFFPGIEPTSGDTIIQPVLQYGVSPAGGGNYYALQSWMVQNGNGYHTPTLDTNVLPGDAITTQMYMRGADATGYNWNICGTVTRTSTQVCFLAHTPELMTWATPAVFEGYGVTACNQLPPEIEFSGIELFTGNFTPVANNAAAATGNPSPNCGNSVRLGTYGTTSLYINQTSAEVFGIGTNPYHLYHQTVGANTSVTAGSWNDWGTLGASGFLNGGPATVSWQAGRIDVFNFDSSYVLRHGYVDSNNSACPSANGTPCVDNWGAAPAGLQFTGEPAVSSQAPGELDIFASTTSGALLQRTWNNGHDSGWLNRGNPGVSIASGPATASFNVGSADVFVIGSDNNVYHGNWNGTSFTWSLWIGAQTANGTVKWQGKPSVASWLPGRFDVMLIDTQGRLYDCGGDGGKAWGSCSQWTPPSGITFTYSPGIVALGAQRLLVAARGSDGQGWMKEWNFGQNTGNWVATGGALAGAQVGISGF